MPWTIAHDFVTGNFIMSLNDQVATLLCFRMKLQYRHFAMENAPHLLPTRTQSVDCPILQELLKMVTVFIAV